MAQLSRVLWCRRWPGWWTPGWYGCPRAWGCPPPSTPRRMSPMESRWPAAPGQSSHCGRFSSRCSFAYGDAAGGATNRPACRVCPEVVAAHVPCHRLRRVPARHARRPRRHRRAGTAANPRWGPGPMSDDRPCWGCAVNPGRCWELPNSPHQPCRPHLSAYSLAVRARVVR
ncbi:Uncharacterised protein [Mycobacteroides abscessus subsp. abscessus]|nr:Uncharacterised protein [Mycobacteroides abscessus subsp. abscessus]